MQNQANQAGFFKMMQDIIKYDGIVGCFRGLTPTLACVPVFWGLYFPIYEHAKPFYGDLYERYFGKDFFLGDKEDEEDDDQNDYNSLVHLAAAMSAGAAADVLVNPMFLVRTRMQTESLHYFVEHKYMPKLTLRETVVSLFREGNGNLLIFWRGLTASLLGLTHVGEFIFGARF